MKVLPFPLRAALTVAMLGAAWPSFGGGRPVYKPIDQAVWNYYPDRAFRTGIQGQALISCAVGDQARLRPC